MDGFLALAKLLFLLLFLLLFGALRHYLSRGYLLLLIFDTVCYTHEHLVDTGRLGFIRRLRGLLILALQLISLLWGFRFSALLGLCSGFLGVLRLQSENSDYPGNFTCGLGGGRT